MTPDAALIKEAQNWLDQLDQDLLKDPQYQKSGEEYERRMEWEIRRYQGEELEAIKEALGRWLRGDDSAKSLFALLLLNRLDAVEYLAELEAIRDQLQSGSSRWPRSRLDLVEHAIRHLREVQHSAGGA